MDALRGCVLLFNREADAYSDDLWYNMIPESVAGLPGDDPLAVRVHVQVIFFPAEAYRSVVASLVNWFVLYPKWEKSAGCGLCAL